MGGRISLATVKIHLPRSTHSTNIGKTFPILFTIAGRQFKMRPFLQFSRPFFTQGIVNDRKEDMVLCCPDPSDIKKELAADNSEVVQEIVCKATDVPEGTMKEVEVRERKIVIINDGGKFLALNGLCSHYNWPLVQGVYSDGKIRCSLHGACFNAKTGDIEDYPAFDSLHPFEVRRIGEDLAIRTTAKRLESNRRTRKSWIKDTNKDKPIIVVGGGISGQSVVENLRLAGSKSPIIMLTKEDRPPYDRVLLSKFMAPDAVPLRTDEWYKENKVDVRINSKVVSLDSGARTVTLTDKTVIQYSKLVLALGGAVRTLNGKGSDLKGIHTVRVISDMKAIQEEVEGKDVVCIGASFIGMEAAAGVKKKASSVTVVCSTEEPNPAFGIDIGKAFRKKWQSRGVNFYTKARVDHLTGGNEGNVKEVVLQSGEKIPAKVVIVGIGVEPDTAWLTNHNVELDKRGYIMVNESFKTNVKDIFAIGDAVSAPLPFWGYETLNIQHFQTAQRHGQLAAWSMLGKPQPGKLIPFFWTLGMEVGARLAGSTHEYDETYVRGDIEAFDWTKYYIRRNVVVAVSTAGKRPAAVQFLALCDQGVRITREDVEENTKDDWAHLLKK